MPERHGAQIVETTTEARQGVTGHKSDTCWPSGSAAWSWPSSFSISRFSCEPRRAAAKDRHSVCGKSIQVSNFIQANAVNGRRFRPL